MSLESEFQGWRTGLAEQAASIAQHADHWSDSEAPPSELVRRYLADPVLAEAFGGPPVSIQLPVSRDYHALWLTSSWGRRCGHYLAMFSQGSRQCGDQSEQMRHCADRLACQAQRIRAHYKPKRPPGVTVLTSLQRKHGLVNFHQTHLDPELFSALILLLAMENPTSAEQSDFGITSDDDERFVRDKILEVIRAEVLKYAGDSNARSPLLVDDSTLWWGASELIRRDRQSFHLEDGGCTGPEFSATFIEKISKWTLKSPACPDYFLAITEGTPEIHCALRTHLLLVMNATKLLSFDSSMLPGNEVVRLLESVRDESLVAAKECWDGEPELQKHAYFIGLTLDVLGRFLPRQRRINEMHDHKKFFAGEGDTLLGPFTKKEWRRILGNMAETTMYRKESSRELRFTRAQGRRGWMIDCSDWSSEELAVLKRDIEKHAG